jgi:manganese/zinc/iron transport system substrate-binding protein
MNVVRNALTALLLFVALAACPGDTATPDPDSAEALKITATIGMIADVAAKIGGDHVRVKGLMGPGVDPHLYKATAGDIGKLREADVVFYNGLHLEGRMADVLVKMASQTRTVQVTNSIPEELLREPPEFLGQYDPHVWMDVSLWKYVAERIRDEFVALDPTHADAYRANAEAYFGEMDALHVYAQGRLAEVPEEVRVLVTAHDAFGYFGRAYDIEVVGIQGISTASEYGLRDLERVSGVLAERDIKAVFVESSVSPRSIEALIEGAKSKGHEVRIGGELFSDAMGAGGTPEGSYIGMIRHNVDTVVEALK